MSYDSPPSPATPSFGIGAESPGARRRTKIVATLGPATDPPAVLNALVAAGVDVVRMNFSHGSADDHRRRVTALREAAARAKRDVAVLADLQGPKIRIGRFAAGPVMLETGQAFTLDINMDPVAGNGEAVAVVYPQLADDVEPGDTLLLDDGRIAMDVESVSGGRIHCRVGLGGEISDNKGINLKGGGLSAPALTEKDLADVRVAAELEVDYLAVSFPKNATDLEQARALMTEAGGRADIVAKIERAEALENLDAIIQASDAVMVARGDLAVEIGDPELPGVQKMIIRRARELNRVVITATQMMESMIANPTPTRAEVLDVANAVLDGTDAVMLSAETATGRYPVKAVEAMGRICMGAERQRQPWLARQLQQIHFERIDEAIAMAAMESAAQLGARAIVSLTESGATTRCMSRVSSGIPIYALTPYPRTRSRVAMYRGVYPVEFDTHHGSRDELAREATRCLLGLGLIDEGELFILTLGDEPGQPGATNTMKILKAS